MKALAQRIVRSRLFERFIITLIVLNGVILGLETSAEVMAHYGELLEQGNDLILAVFVLEAALKITAVAPRVSRYFGDGWNLFDFGVVVVSLIPAAGQWAMLARLGRLLRVMRLISTLPELRLIVATLVRSLPGMGNVIFLLSILFYVYAVAGWHLFHDTEPELWGTLGLSQLTLFRVVTLEDWTDVMYSAMEAYPWSWLYFVSFIVTGTFVVINLFIAVVINNLERAKAESLEELRQPPSRDLVLRELRMTQDALRRLQEQLEQVESLRTEGNRN